MSITPGRKANATVTPVRHRGLLHVPLGWHSCPSSRTLLAELSLAGSGMELVWSKAGTGQAVDGHQNPVPWLQCP